MKGGDEVELRGVLPTGPFRLRGRITRVVAEEGELGVALDQSDASLHALLRSAIAGTE